MFKWVNYPTNIVLATATNLLSMINQRKLDSQVHENQSTKDQGQKHPKTHLAFKNSEICCSIAESSRIIPVAVGRCGFQLYYKLDVINKS